MSYASSGTSASSSDTASLSSAVRTPTARRSLPGSRAIVGGLLIAVAGLGTYAIATGVTGDNTRSVVVAAKDLSAGTVLTADDLTVVTADISGEFAGATMAQPSVAVGTTLLGPIKAGEVLQVGSLAASSGGATTGPEISFSLPSARALGGSLSSGESVDVLVTNKNEVSASASTAVSNAKVVKIGTAGNAALGGAGDVTITVSVPSRAEAAAIAAAIDGGNVTLVRTTGLDGSR